MSRYPYLSSAAVLLLLIAFVTWPQCLYLASKFADHSDPYLSSWRLAWLAHALRTQPWHLFDGNIYYPARFTLAYSDATLFEGVVAAPFLWAGVPLVLVYNLLLLGGMALSGLGMFVLVRHLTASDGAALVSAVIFALAPYRVEHFMHLELQWAACMPLAFWAVHRAVREDSWRFGVLAGLLVAVQLVASVYYGVFLGLTVAVLAFLIVAWQPQRAQTAIAGLLAGAAVAAILAFLYSRPYVESANLVGVRGLGEISHFSAWPSNYLASPAQNWVWGWTADRFGAMERRLFPGLIAIALAVVSVARRPRAIVWLYVALCAIAVELSFGFNGWLYGWLYSRLWVLEGLRVPARWAIVVLAALAVLAGFGFTAIERRQPKGKRRRCLLVATLALLATEYASAPMHLVEIPKRVPDVYRVFNSLDPGVLVELPPAEPGWMPRYDGQHQFWSTTHWRPLLNGYSGYITREYRRTTELMVNFPDDASIARLRNLGVRYLIVHQILYKPEDYTALLLRMARRPELIPHGSYDDWAAEARLFELKR